MLNVKAYLEDIRYIINIKSTAQLKMFVMKYMQEVPNLEYLLDLDKQELKLYLYYLKKEKLADIEQELKDLSDD